MIAVFQAYFGGKKDFIGVFSNTVEAMKQHDASKEGILVLCRCDLDEPVTEENYKDIFEPFEELFPEAHAKIQARKNA